MGINVLLAFMIIGSFLLAIVLHEWGHALMALWLGDYSPRAEGRLTLSLRSHIDPVGLLMCVVLAFRPILTFPVGLGWGKPVRPDPWKMRVGANTGVFLVTCAGPLCNLIVGILTAIVMRFTIPFLMGNFWTQHLLQLLLVFAVTNFALVLFNILPFYPLDGYQIVYTLLPSQQARQFARSAPYGQFIILALFFLVPFLAQLAGVGSFPLFRLNYYIWLGAVYGVIPITGPELNVNLYLF